VSAELAARLTAAVDPLDADHPEPPSGQRRAAVLLLADPSSPGVPVLFVRRADHLRQHAGQIALPGGSADPGDADLVATALREAGEEVGLAATDVEVIGTLPPLLTAVSDLWLTPVVALERRRWEVRGDGWEVAEWFHVRLDDLLTAPHSTQVMERDGRRRIVHFYDVDGRIIWGVTAAILHGLLARLGRTD
jgi:8-oxo-dGTP pyrophosphatase MutT (NUDIX family)